MWENHPFGAAHDLVMHDLVMARQRAACMPETPRGRLSTMVRNNVSGHVSLSLCAARTQDEAAPAHQR